MKRFLGLLMAIPMFACAQSNFQKGYLVTNKLDTVRGLIDYQERDLNPSELKFRINMDSKTETYTLENCSGFAIEGFEYYRRFTINVSLSKIRLSELTEGPDTTTKRAAVFLKLLQEGRFVTLYSYTDGIKQRFYIQERSAGEPEELINDVYLHPDGSKKMVTNRKFVRQMDYAARKFNNGSPIDQRNLLRLNYGRKALNDIVSKINGESVIKKTEHASPGSRFFAGIGLNRSKARYSGENVFAGPDVTSKVSYSPLLSVGIDFFANPTIGKLIYRLELSFLSSKNEFIVNNSDQSDYFNRHRFKEFAVAMNPQIVYNFYNTRPVKIFVAGGFGLNFSKYTDNKTYRYVKFYEQEYIADAQIDFENFNFFPQFSLGTVVREKFEFSAAYSFDSSITDYTYFNVGMSRVLIGAKYLFGRKK